MAKPDGNSGVGDYFGDGARDAVGEEARVVADNDSARGIFMFQNVAGDGSRNAANVVESEVVGDQAAPTVGAEFDCVMGQGSSSLLASRWSLVVGRWRFVIASALGIANGCSITKGR